MIALDYTARIPPAALIAAGVSDVSRYLCYSPIGDWKTIRKAEYDELLAAGIGVTLNWELDARDWAHGEATGQAHGAEAVRQAHALGYPAGCTIIGSADFDMTRLTWDISGRFYARGFAAAIHAGGYAPGVYGPYDVLTWCRATGLFVAFWQAGMSTSWSAGRNSGLWPGAHLRQRRHLSVAGQDTDVSDILIPDWGQARRVFDTKEALGSHTVTFLVNHAGTVYKCGDFRQPAPDGPTALKWRALGLPETSVSSSVELDRVAGPPLPDLAQLAADLAAVKAAFGALAAAGGSTDSAAIIAHMDSLAAAEVARDQAHAAVVADLRAKLAAAERAAADALNA